MYRAASTMYAFWQEMSREESMCDCADRSWYGDGHDSQCNVTLINNMLDEIGTVEPERQPAAEQWGKPQQAKSYFVLFVESDVEPHLHGPFPTAEERDQVAKNLRALDRSDPKSGIYRLDCTAPEIDSYSGAFFEEGENTDTTEICTPGARS